jgi:cell division septum initiation protein DivIVA
MTDPPDDHFPHESELDGLDAEALIGRSLDVVNSAKTMPLSASVLVSRDELVHLLGLAMDRLPNELREARWLLKEREEFMAERDREAQALMDEVRAQAERMVARTDIVRQANRVAQRILDDANEEARRMRHETEDYCDQRLAGMEIVLDRTMKTVRSGRQKLQAISSPAERQRTVPAPAEDAQELEGESFFDQDRT